jgi:uncharacterized protein YbjQ (UPF0145 family)
MDDVIIFTSPIVEGDRIAEYKGLVTAKNVRAVNVVRDFFTVFRDFFGGRSMSYQAVMEDVEREVISEIKEKAKNVGANAIVGFALDFDNISAKRKSLLMAYAKGTAVVLK